MMVFNWADKTQQFTVAVVASAQLTALSPSKMSAGLNT
jgi:hypothetical protein